MLTPYKLPDNGIPIKVGDSSYIYKDVYNPIEWHNGEPYRPRVETLVLSPDGMKIFLRLKDKGGYRLPGGSIDSDSTYLQQAENETNEEALLKVRDTKFTGITYYQPMDKKYIKKGGDTPLAYVGSITYVYTSFVDGKVDKSTIEEKDLDDDMASHGKFYNIPSVLDTLHTYHIEALLKNDTLSIDPLAKHKLYEELNRRQIETDSTPMFESKGMDPYIYHGSIYKFDVFYPMSLDLGNGQQKPGWSTFCFSEYRLAKRFALMRLLQKHLEPYKDKGTNYVCNWDLRREKPYLHQDVYEEIKDSLMGQSFYVYTVDGSKLELGLGNDMRFPEVTFRESGVLPESVDRITVTSDLIFQDCYLVSQSDIQTYEKNLNSNLSDTHRGWLSCMLNRNYSEDSAIAKLTKAVSDGKLNPGDDVEAYMKEHHIAMKDISFVERLPEVTRTTVQDAFDTSAEFEEEWILGDNRVLFTSEKKKGLNIAPIQREMLPDLETLNHMNPVTFHKGYLYLMEEGKLRTLGLVDATYCDMDKDNVVVRLFIEPMYRRNGIGTVLLRDTFRRIVSPTGEPYHVLMACSNRILEKISKLKKWGEKLFGLSVIGTKGEYTLFQSAQRGLLRGDVMEACKNIDEARKFVSEVGKLAKKYDANYFIVTDGASGKHNKDNENQAVNHARDAHMEWEKQNAIDPFEDWKKGIAGEPFYFYHLIPKGATITDGIVSLQYQYDTKDFVNFRHNAMKYADRLCGSWGIYPNRNPESLTNDELLNGIKQFRQDSKDGANRIYLFAYPPYVQLGRNMKNVLKNKDLYRIDLNDAEVTKWIDRIDWGYVGSDSRNRPLTKMDYVQLTKEAYFSSYQESGNQLLFAPLYHIAIIPKKGYLPKKLWDKIPIPNSQKDIVEHGPYMMVESSMVRPSEVDLTKFCYYHIEPDRKGFHPKTAGGWDEELYSKDIEYAIRNDCNNVKENEFRAHVFTMDDKYKTVYLGILSIRRFEDKKYGWEWAEQQELDPSYVHYLANHQREGLMLVENVTVYDVVDLTKSYDEVDDVMTETLEENVDLEPIFIVCSFTGTPFGKLIQKFQHCKFSHAGIAFDTNLKEIFTFNMRTELETKERKGKDPVTKKKVAGGAYVESIDDYIKFGEGGDCDLCILCIFVSRSIKESIQQGIEKIFSQIDKTKYAVSNVFNIAINRSVETGNSMKMICSQFVDRILRIGNINLVDKSSNLVSPNDFVQAQKKNDKIFALYDGKGSKYNPKKTERMIRKIKNSPNRGHIRIAPPEESSITMETVLKSTLDTEFKRKGTLHLSAFRKVRLTQSLVNSFKDKNYKLMRYINDVDYLGIGYAWLDGNALVGYVFVEDSWITALEVTPDYQGYGLSEELIKYAIGMGGKRLSVYDDNEIAIRAYKKCGFKEVPSKVVNGDGEKHMVYMTCDPTLLKSMQESIDIFEKGHFDAYAKYANLDAAREDVVEESIVFNKDNLCYNVDKFESGESNILLVTGLSGSGKSTIATKIAKETHAEVIELDIFEHCYGYSDNNLKQAGDVFYEYLSKHPSLWESLKKKELSGKDLGKEIDKFVHFVIRWCKSRKETKWVIEGVQIYSFLTAGEVKQYPLIIMGTSAKNSILQRFKRDGDGKIKWGEELKNEFPNLIAWYWGDEKSLQQFRKEVKGMLETVVLEADEDDDGLPSLGKDDKTADYTEDAENEDDVADSEEETTDDDDNNGDEENVDADNEEGEDDLSDLDDDSSDYTEDASTSEDDGADDTDDSSEDYDTNSADTDETDSQTTNNTIKNYQILRNFESLYRLASEISDTLEPMLMEKPIQNRVLVQVRENLSAIKKAINDYITLHFNSKDYHKHSYYYEVYFEALKKNVEMLEKNQLFSKDSDKKGQETKTGGKK